MVSSLFSGLRIELSWVELNSFHILIVVPFLRKPQMLLIREQNCTYSYHLRSKGKKCFVSSTFMSKLYMSLSLFLQISLKPCITEHTYNNSSAFMVFVSKYISWKRSLQGLVQWAVLPVVYRPQYYISVILKRPYCHVIFCKTLNSINHAADMHHQIWLNLWKQK